MMVGGFLFGHSSRAILVPKQPMIPTLTARRHGGHRSYLTQQARQTRRRRRRLQQPLPSADSTGGGDDDYFTQQEQLNLTTSADEAQQRAVLSPPMPSAEAVVLPPVVSVVDVEEEESESNADIAAAAPLEMEVRRTQPTLARSLVKFENTAVEEKSEKEEGPRIGGGNNKYTTSGIPRGSSSSDVDNSEDIAARFPSQASQKVAEKMTLDPSSIDTSAATLTTTSDSGSSSSGSPMDVVMNMIYNSATGLAAGWLNWSWHGTFNTRDTLLALPELSSSSSTDKSIVNDDLAAAQATATSSTTTSIRASQPASMYAKIEPYGALVLKSPTMFSSMSDGWHTYLEASVYVHRNSPGSLWDVHVHYEGFHDGKHIKSAATSSVPSYYPRDAGVDTLKGRWVRLVMPLPPLHMEESPWNTVQLMNMGTSAVTMNVGAMTLKASTNPVEQDLQFL